MRHEAESPSCLAGWLGPISQQSMMLRTLRCDPHRGWVVRPNLLTAEYPWLSTLQGSSPRWYDVNHACEFLPLMSDWHPSWYQLSMLLNRYQLYVNASPVCLDLVVYPGQFQIMTFVPAHSSLLTLEEYVLRSPVGAWNWMVLTQYIPCFPYMQLLCCQIIPRLANLSANALGPWAASTSLLLHFGAIIKQTKGFLSSGTDLSWESIRYLESYQGINGWVLDKGLIHIPSSVDITGLGWNSSWYKISPHYSDSAT